MRELPRTTSRQPASTALAVSMPHDETEPIAPKAVNRSASVNPVQPRAFAPP
ncbi:hypothetical protein LC55x_4116 [Lysobacter capsici]|nr:hypothetical protein LC55x_4116 [Lysobacter capsici]